ncbi:hypothetical protein HAX54_040423 [Datura stramonium]|uniref:Uncharacterized protein n=1 Tax=Datura stramonium TaxID=4076 RepID=A0ABS8SKA3_DATST|nr:hypothetical protein [Datura stramonium]
MLTLHNHTWTLAYATHEEIWRKELPDARPIWRDEGTMRTPCLRSKSCKVQSQSSETKRAKAARLVEEAQLADAARRVDAAKLAAALAEWNRLNSSCPRRCNVVQNMLFEREYE